MTPAAAKFLLSLELGFLNRAKLETLKALHPFCPVLVRCGCGRFTCAAQDAQHFINIIDNASKADPRADYIRDVAATCEALDEARRTPQEPPARPRPECFGPEPVKVNFRQSRRLSPHFNEADCGGVFDGFQVTSDADPGL